MSERPLRYRNKYTCKRCAALEKDKETGEFRCMIGGEFIVKDDADTPVPIKPCCKPRNRDEVEQAAMMMIEMTSQRQEA